MPLSVVHKLSMDVRSCVYELHGFAPSSCLPKYARKSPAPFKLHYMGKQKRQIVLSFVRLDKRAYKKNDEDV